MYDTDNDSKITLDEYRNVCMQSYLLCSSNDVAFWYLFLFLNQPFFYPVQVVEELLSGNLHIEKETARSIADGAMMEAASLCVGQMVMYLLL